MAIKRALDPPRELVKKFVADSKGAHTYQSLSGAIGRNVTYIQQWITKVKGPLPEEERLKLAAIMGVHPNLLRSGQAPMVDVSPPVAGIGRVSTLNDLPVFASAEGGPHGAMVISQEPIEHVKRPEPLFNVPSGFGCYVLGDSMSPAFEHGDVLLVHPSRPVRPEDDCLFVRNADGSTDALVKRLVRSYPDRWRVRQFNPARDFDLNRAEWQQVMRIVGKYYRS